MRVSILLFLSAVSAEAVSERYTLVGSQVCQQIAASILGEVYYSYSLSLNFASNIQHWMSSSSQTPMCVVEVNNAQDVSRVMKIVASTRTPFAIKSGGHATNPGFSSTTGIHISLKRINQVNLSADKKTVEVGLGNIWSDVYTALDGSGYNVVGGRVVGPGTGGVTLGGGYSWLTNQYGLTCDTVVSYTLVLPNGTITTVDSTKSDLFFALKGGLNRFGIVTSIIFRAVPQPNLVYGGLQFFGEDAIPAVINATNVFQATNTDPKAQVIFAVYGGVFPGAILISFYDGPMRPAAFAPYDNIKGFQINTLQVQSFKSLVQASPVAAEAGNRGAFATLSTITLTQAFLEAVHNESIFYGAMGILHSGIFISYEVDPFLKYGKYATDSAYPHADSPLPVNLYYSWSSPSEDAFWRGMMQQSINHLADVAKAEGIYYDGAAYPNYALSTYTGAQLYGATNAARLRKIQAKYDPSGVMLLAGGFII